MDILAERDFIIKHGLKQKIEELALRRIGPQPKLWVAIDEAQKCPALFEQIKVIYDTHKDNDAIKFILTGSAYLNLQQLSTESLAGRVELFQLQEFNLVETVRYLADISLPKVSFLDCILQNNVAAISRVHDEMAPYRVKLLDGLAQQLVWGGLPEVLKLSDENHRLKYLSAYLQTYLEKDITPIHAINDLQLYRHLLDIVAEQTGSVRQDKNILDALSCARETLKKYRGYLSATLIYHEIYPYIQNTLKRLVKSPKGYLLNNGMISYLTGLRELETLTKTGIIGHRFENWMLKELLVACARCYERTNIYYWRTSSGIEVDFILEKKPDIYPIEITYSEKINQKKLKNMKTFLQTEPKAKVGIFIYLGKFKYDPGNNIYFIPAWMVS